MNFFNRIKHKIKNKTDNISQSLSQSLTKTRESFLGAINSLFSSGRRLNEEFYEELEELLISSDVGAKTTLYLVDKLREIALEQKISDATKLREILFEQIHEILTRSNDTGILNTNPTGLTVYLFVGVNGVGKTTTIGKLAYKFKSEGKNVILAAGDTFRAGSIEQIDVWGKRVGIDVIKHQPGSDPAAVIYDGLQAARARKADVLLCDTAGRLQNKVNLMSELRKINSVIERELPDAPHEVLLVVDSTMGQNALMQAKEFSNVTPVSGLVLTKIDGTAKGGITIAISHELNIPVKLIGFGEHIEGLKNFSAEEFLEALLSPPS